MNYFRIIKKSSIACSFFVVLFSCSQPNKTNGYFETNGQVFGTLYTIKYQGYELQKESIDSVFNIFNSQFSTYQSDTELSCYNESNDSSCFSKEGLKRFQYLINLSEEVNQNSFGAFDPTAAVLFESWGFGRNKENDIPKKEEIDSLMRLVGWDKIYSGEKHTLNFNAVAKGYAVDVICRYFESNAIQNYFVEVGGEVRCKGVNTQKEVWRVGVNKPATNSGSSELIEIIELNEGAIATSGNYRQFFLDDEGNALGHTIDPRIGKPVMNDLLSATILAEDCATADAYATTCMVLGLKESTALVERIEGLQALFVVHGADSTLNVIKVGKVKTVLQ